MKSSFKPTLASLLAMALLGAVVSAQAQTNAPKSAAKSTEGAAAPAKAKHETLPFHGKVAAVDKASQTIMLEGKEGKRIFEANAKTKITKDGKPATLADVVVGDKVGGAYKKGAGGKLEAVTLNFGEKAEKVEKPKVEAPKVEAPKVEAPAAPAAPAKP